MIDIFSNKKYLIIGGAVLIVSIFLILVLILGRGFGFAPQKNVTLQFWGVFDNSSFYADAISAYQRDNRHVQIIYRVLNFEDYEKQLIDSFAAGTGPDIWLIHNTWLPKHFDKITPLPQSVQSDTKKPLFTFKDFQEQFVDVAVSDLTSQGQIYAMPTYMDTLALYWNKDLFNARGISTPPATWDQFNENVSSLTSFDEIGNINIAGGVIGTAKNINRSTDILSLLMLQSGTQMINSTNSGATFSRPVNNQPVGESALRYYTDFANPSRQLYTWNDSQHYSIDAFQEGKAAMMFNYSHTVDVLRAKTSRLNFGVAPMPQFANSNKLVNYANYWAPTIAKASPNSLEAWKFLVYLTSTDGAKAYLKNSHRPAARRDIIETQKTDPDLGVFAVQGLSARSWYQIDNSAIEKIFADMIDSINFQQTPIRNALIAAENKISLLMTKARQQ